MPDLPGDPAVRPHLARRDLERLPEHRLLELRETAQVEAQIPPSPRPPGCGRAPARAPEARASPRSRGARSAARTRARTPRPTSPASPSRCPPCCARCTPGRPATRAASTCRPDRRAAARPAAVSRAPSRTGEPAQGPCQRSASRFIRLHFLTPSRRDATSASRRALIAAMDVGFRGADRLAEHLGHLVEPQALDVAQEDRRAVPVGQPRHERRHVGAAARCARSARPAARPRIVRTPPRRAATRAQTG